MDQMTESQLHALRNLARKRSGDDVPFVNIADARALTELGFAERSREGWDITDEGLATLARMAPPPAGAGEAGREAPQSLHGEAGPQTDPNAGPAPDPERSNDG